FDDGTFRPGEEVTRAQAAVFITNILDAMMPAEADSRM
ncbi:MAG: S-layer homology domain-containing protein, partial [Firmicutes bacterium]|nr:S-layer homology domain-containing protein [Bacillota bacterium]